jgi:hypothetical protein
MENFTEIVIVFQAVFAFYKFLINFHR